MKKNKIKFNKSESKKQSYIYLEINIELRILACPKIGLHKKLRIKKATFIPPYSHVKGNERTHKFLSMIRYLSSQSKFL